MQHMRRFMASPAHWFSHYPDLPPFSARPACAKPLLVQPPRLDGLVDDVDDAMRKFNTSGPVVPSKHYSIPPLERIDLVSVLSLIHDEKYFILHAPRQSGKTSTLLALRDRLNSYRRTLSLRLRER